MSISFLTALLLQIVTIPMLRYRLGRHWLRRPVVVFLLVSLVTLGIGPALLAIPSIAAQDNYRVGIQTSFIDLADLIMSAAMLAFTITYLLTHPERAGMRCAPDAITLAAQALDWRILGVACIPLTVITTAGRGYSSRTAAGEGPGLATSLVSEFFIILIVLAAAGFLLRYGTRWFLPVLLIQSTLLALAGERTPVLMDAIALILVLLFAGLRLPPRQLMGAVVLTIVAITAISGVRAEQGRYVFYSNSGILNRVSALAIGIVDVSGAQDHTGKLGPVAQFAVRESGVDFAGGILEALSEGQPRLSPALVPESLLLAVPSFAWSSKLAHSNYLNPALLEIDGFGLQRINYIPGVPGLYIGFLSPPWLVVLFALLGVIFGWFERWLMRECTPARTTLLAGAVIAAFWPGLPTMLEQMRAAAAVALAVKVVEIFRRRAPVVNPSLPVAGASVASGRSSWRS